MISSSPSEPVAANLDSFTLPSYCSISEAARHLAGNVIRTPLLESPVINELYQSRILVKAESLQRTGSFKFRGAYNRVRKLSKAEKERGVVAYSSGNHAQGVAAACRIHGVNATIVMPTTAPFIKQKATRDQGAEVILHGGSRLALEAMAHNLVKEKGGVLIKPFDDSHVISGQGTVGLEIAGQIREKKISLDAIVIPCGGGGLGAGIAVAFEKEMPNCEILLAEPENFDDTKRSLKAGKRIKNSKESHSICDALLVPVCGEMTFPILQRYVSRGVIANDIEVERAIVSLFTHLKLVVEPAGAIAAATCFSNKLDIRGKTVAVIASGGNVDTGLFADILNRHSVI